MSLSIKRSPISQCLVFLALFCCFQSAQAQVNGDWQLQGKLLISTNVGGKSASIKNKNLAQVTASFTSDMLCSISGESFAIPCMWTAKKRSFKTQMMPSAVNSLLRSLEKDLAAKSGLAVLLEADTVTLSGSERNNGTIKGRLKIKARTTFLDYENKQGSFTLTYDFIGAQKVLPAN